MRNLLERAGWTAVQAAAAFLAVELADVSVAWAPVIAVALSAVKTFAQDKLALKRG
jgi:uncharacterized lipoprotein YbaY